MLKYAVALTWYKNNGPKMSIQTSLTLVDANSKEEAFGKSFEAAERREEIKDHTFSHKVVIEIKDENFQ